MTDTDPGLFEPDKSDPHNCPECGQHFDGVMWALDRGRHRKKEHGVQPAGRHKSAAQRRAERSGKPTRETPPDVGGEVTKEKRPEIKRARVTLTNLGTSAWGGLAWVAGWRGQHPLSRSLQLVAPAAGPAIEKGLKGSFLDKMLQPIARVMDSGGEWGTVVGLPVSTQAFVANPNPLTEASFVGALTTSLPTIVKTMKEAKRKQEKLESDLSEFAEVFGKQPGEKVSIREVAEWILGPPQESPPGSSDYEANGNHADATSNRGVEVLT